jgi:hypothetical protein
LVAVAPPSGCVPAGVVSACGVPCCALTGAPGAACANASAGIVSPATSAIADVERANADDVLKPLIIILPDRRRCAGMS